MMHRMYAAINTESFILFKISFSIQYPMFDNLTKDSIDI